MESGLEDGVVIVMAPLWRLVPQHKPWQKELKSHWESLGAGKYDWAQLAMHLWPERVIPRCAEIAASRSHMVSTTCSGRRTLTTSGGARTPTRAIDELIAGRTSSAVKDALNNLTTAPALTSGRRTPRESEPRSNPLHDYLCDQLDEEARGTSGRRLLRSEVGVRAALRPRASGRRRRALTACIAYSSANGKRSSRATTGRCLRCEPRSSRSVAEDSLTAPDLSTRCQARSERVGVDGAREGRGDLRTPTEEARAHPAPGSSTPMARLTTCSGPESLTYDDVVSYLEQAGNGDQGSVLKTIFGGASSEALLTLWLADETHDARSSTKARPTNSFRLIEARLGLSLSQPNAPVGEARSKTVRYVLVNEFRADLDGDPPASVDHDRVDDDARAARSRSRRLPKGCGAASTPSGTSSSLTKSRRNSTSAAPRSMPLDSVRPTLSGSRNGACLRHAVELAVYRKVRRGDRRCRRAGAKLLARSRRCATGAVGGVQIDGRARARDRLGRCGTGKVASVRRRLARCLRKELVRGRSIATEARNLDCAAQRRARGRASHRRRAAGLRRALEADGHRLRQRHSQSRAGLSPAFFLRRACVSRHCSERRAPGCVLPR